MKKVKPNSVVVAGSLAFDSVMNFPGRFSDHLIAGKIHDLSVSFPLSEVNVSHGGTAGNIAYNLALLQESTKILTAIGADFFSYGQKLKSLGVDLSALKKASGRSAAAFIITDKADNQIAGFFPGPTGLPAFSRLKPAKIALVIISPDQKKRMLAVWRWCLKYKLPYIFDPGQQVINFSAKELKDFISGSKLVIGNDYEIEIISRCLNKKMEQISSADRPLIVTKGDQGSKIIIGNHYLSIPTAKPKKNLDPTGAGDAYRAGLIKGIMADLPLVQSAKLGATVAAYAVENKGTQEHKFSLLAVKRRFYQNFKEKLLIN